MRALRFYVAPLLCLVLPALGQPPSYDIPHVQQSADTGEACLDFSELLGKARENLKSDFPPLQTRAVLDGERTLSIPAAQSRFCFRPPHPEDQHDVSIEVLAADAQTILHRTPPFFVAEAKKPPAIDAASFAGFARPETLLPERLTRAWGIDADLARLTSDIGFSNIVLVPKPPLKLETPHIGARQGIQVTFERDEPKLITLTDSLTGKVTPANPDDFEVKVDAAFNGNAFFWDDMFVSWATTWHDPRRARATLDFWYSVQELGAASPGSIPREVRKGNLLSFNPYLRYEFGALKANLDYSNPNLSGMTEWQLFALSEPRQAARDLPRAIRSMEDYAAWFEKERATRDAQGAPIDGAFIASNLGSGMDNSPRGGAQPERASWVDMLAQQVELYKNVARMKMALGNWEGAANSEAKARHFESVLNAQHWSASQGFYFDRVPDAAGTLQLDENTATIAGFWPLWSGSASTQQVEALVDRQLTPARFGGEFPLASLSAEHPLYSDEGHYWLGGRWPNMAAIAIQGFESSGRPDIAFDLTRKFLRGMTQASDDAKPALGRGTVYEFYGLRRGVDGARAMAGIEPGHTTRADFVGWGKVPPVQNMIRNLIGLRPVPGYAGTDLERWVRSLVDSPLLNTGNYFRFNPSQTQPEQRAQAAQGYLEWNLMVDPGRAEGLRVRNIEYQGQRLRELGIQRVGTDAYLVTVQSDQPVSLQVNRLFRAENEDQPESSVALRAPVAASPLRRVGGADQVQATFVLSEVSSSNNRADGDHGDTRSASAAVAGTRTSVDWAGTPRRVSRLGAP